MDSSKSREALAEFLDYLADKGLMAKPTAMSRKAAASKILGILEKGEASDVTAIDIDNVVSRFGNLHGKDYTPQSLTTYKSRLHSAIEDFRTYLANPLAFRPSVQNRERTKVKPNKESPKAVPEARAEPTRSAPTPMTTSNILPIAIRADLTVYIQGLPLDLTQAEARKISAVVVAMAQAEEL
jgi:hypothetical protein